MYFSRLQLAQEMCEALRGNNLFNDAPNGLFLAAPRRTGKSTFLQADLQPELEKRGIVVVYVDLWAAPLRDPGDLIAETIGRALRALHELAKAPVALIVNEAQHSLTSKAGENAMTALKSARDQLKARLPPNGAHKDKHPSPSRIKREGLKLKDEAP